MLHQQPVGPELLKIIFYCHNHPSVRFISEGAIEPVLTIPKKLFVSKVAFGQG